VRITRWRCNRGSFDDDESRTTSWKSILNLARRMKLTGIDQPWGGRHHLHSIENGSVCLAVILHGFSRKVVDWRLKRTLAPGLALGTLQQAIAAHRPPRGESLRQRK
jgi:transposase InsO family protein